MRRRKSHEAFFRSPLASHPEKRMRCVTPSIAIFYPEAPLQLRAQPKLREALEAGAITTFILNLKHLTMLNSLEVGTLSYLHTHLSTREGWLLLCEVAPAIREILPLFQLDTILPVYPSEAEALQAALSERNARW